MTTHPIRFIVALRDDQADVFDCISGVAPTGVFATEERTIDTGTIVGAIRQVPNSLLQHLVLHRVTEDGLNELDDQPVPGDIAVSICPQTDLPFQAGMMCVFVDNGESDGAIAVVSIGLLLALFPLLAQDWLSQVPAMLGEALTVLNIPGQIRAALSTPVVTDDADYTWDGTDRVIVWASTENVGPLTVHVPPAFDVAAVPAVEADPENNVEAADAIPAVKVEGHSLTVSNHTATNIENPADITIALTAVHPDQGDIVVPPGHTCTIRATHGSYVITSWV